MSFLYDDRQFQTPWTKWQKYWTKWEGMRHLAIGRPAIEELAKEYWAAAGQPEGKDAEFWLKAETELRRRMLAASGVGGVCESDPATAKEIAIQQFCRRRHFALLTTDPVIRTTQPAGTPFTFYCPCCGIITETVPGDYMFEILEMCSQCKGLKNCGWLDEALVVAKSAGYNLNISRNYHETRKEIDANPPGNPPG